MLSAEIDGAVELREAMHKFTPDLANNLENEMAKALQPIVTKARGLVPNAAPLSNWQRYSMLHKGKFPIFNANEIRRGIYSSTTPTQPNRKGFSYAAQIVNSTAAGAIYETAGRKNPNGRKQNKMVAYAVKTSPFTQEFGGYRRDTNKKYSSSSNPNAGKQFIDSLPELYKTERIKGQVGRRSRKSDGRLIFKAWGQNQGRVNSAVLTALDTSIKEFHARTNNVSKPFTKKRAA